MHLKSLELIGYKTFAGRTNFEFASSITAIVGPNGSGKSNIADSIRWVLGEQSYSLLRGKKTVDMIFSGSENRSQAGMASVSIVFDNSSGWLPIEFSEVSITRRAYRDGTNEYMINGQKVRLKDVGELLGKSGLSERTYTIIGQGMVDAALALRAEDRRRLFEEAAGIGLYRSRRQEASRRLEATERNIERVDDILAELKPRLRSLERQARKAKEFEQLKADLKIMLRDYYGFHWYRTQQDCEQAIKDTDKRQARLVEIKNNTQAVDAELDHCRGEIADTRNKLSGWQNESSELFKHLALVNQDIAVAEERFQSFSMDQNRTETDLLRLEAQEDIFQSRIDAESTSVDKLLEQIDEIRGQRDKIKEQYTSFAEKLKDVENQKIAAIRKRTNILTDIHQHNARKNEYKIQIARQRDRLEQNRNVLDDLQVSLRNLRKEYESKKRNRSEQEVIIQELRNILQDTGEQLTKERRKRESLEESAREHRARLDKLKLDQSLLVNLLDQKEGFIEGARTLVSAIQKGKLKGKGSQLSHYLKSPVELEVAIEACLRDLIDAVIIQDSEALEASLKILEEKEISAALLPVSSLNKIPAINLKGSDKNVIGLASQLVESPLELRPIIDTFLGRTIVVTNRKNVDGLFEKNPDAISIVTLNGEVFYSSGMVSTSSRKATNPLRINRKVSKVQNEIADQKTIVGELNLKIDKSVKIIDQSISKNRHNQQLLDEKTKAFNKTNEIVNKQAIAVDKLLQKEEYLEERVLGNTSEINRMEKEIGIDAEKVNGLNSRLTGIDQEITLLSARIAEFDIGDLKDQTVHWDTEYTVSTRALSDYQRRLDERSRDLQDFIERKEQIRNHIGKLKEEIATTVEQKSMLTEKETRIKEEINQLEGFISPERERLTKLVEGRRKLYERESKSRMDLNNAERLFAQSQVNYNRKQDRMTTLRERIEDDFGLVSFEYSESISGPKPLPFSGMVESLPILNELPKGFGESIKRLRAQVRRMGSINPEAQEEYHEVKQRYEFLNDQLDDLDAAKNDVNDAILELDIIMKKEFMLTFEAVSKEFSEMFVELFGGGSAKLELIDPDDITSSGIDIEARLPGRRSQALSLLSGGERSLTATALVFSLLKVSPTPFCVLDEVDAMLDEVNVGRFREKLRELSENTQFVIITHNRNTVQAADVIYGITMGKDSVSRVISLKLDEVSEVIPA